MESRFEVKVDLVTPEEIKEMKSRFNRIYLTTVSVAWLITLASMFGPWPGLWFILALVSAFVTWVLRDQPVPETLDQLIEYDNERLAGYKNLGTKAALKPTVHNKEETYQVVFLQNGSAVSVYLIDCMYSGKVGVDPGKSIYKYEEWAFVVDMKEKTALVFEME